MKEKMLDLMKSEGLKPSQLAEMLGIKPAGISHILAERNKPSFDMLQKILRRFPRLNPDWLLLDSDKMYRDDIDSTPKQSAPISTTGPTINDGLFGTLGTTPSKVPEQTTSAAPENYAPTTTVPFSGTRTDVAVRRVVILYDDMTFESFTPTKR